MEYFKLYNEIAEKYPASEIVYATPGGKAREEYLSRHLSKGEGLTLDIGCNDGRFSKHVKGVYVGIDIAVPCLAKFKEHRAWALAQQIPFRNGVFDRVTLIETMEHIWERDEVLQECLRVLKPGGTLILSAPYGNKPWQIIKTGEKLKQYGVSPARYLHGTFNPDYVRRLLQENGFKPTKMVLLCRKDFVKLGVIPKGHWPTLVSFAHGVEADE